ncbi:MAG: resolvase [Thermoplasmata archaeon HGW-Thermoplasmata-1]|nr:MAG: resolvase [Thermoplasmata archaeon HGW-Thermoplasmata-1]
MKKAAIYVRVSTGKQDIVNQLPVLKRFASTRGFSIVRTFSDVASGARADRVEFNKMMSAAAAGEFDTILVWALDRLSREGMSKTVNLIEHLNKIGVDVVSYTEPYLDTTNELAKNILLAVVSTLAKAEREKISERTKAGLERLRRQGKKLGRPPFPGSVREKIRALKKNGYGARETARKLNVSHVYVINVLKSAGNKRGIKKAVSVSTERALKNRR